VGNDGVEYRIDLQSATYVVNNIVEGEEGTNPKVPRAKSAGEQLDRNRPRVKRGSRDKELHES